jgi:hypothetical protein
VLSDGFRSEEAIEMVDTVSSDDCNALELFPPEEERKLDFILGSVRLDSLNE